MAGPKRPQDRVELPDVKKNFHDAFQDAHEEPRRSQSTASTARFADGAVVIAAITSCTNTSNPSVMLAAGLLAKKAVERGLKVEAVGEDQPRARLQSGDPIIYNEAGLTAVSGSAQFPPGRLRLHHLHRQQRTAAGAVAEAVQKENLVVAAVLSGNRNFEGRINPQVKANYLASPPLVVAYALAGHGRYRSRERAAGHGSDGKPVYLRDIWPTNEEVQRHRPRRPSIARCSEHEYAHAFDGDANWQTMPVPTGGILRVGRALHLHQEAAVLRPHGGSQRRRSRISPGMRVLALLGDSVTTDHISPAGIDRRRTARPASI